MPKNDSAVNKFSLIRILEELTAVEVHTRYTTVAMMTSILVRVRSAQLVISAARFRLAWPDPEVLMCATQDIKYWTNI